MGWLETAAWLCSCGLCGGADDAGDEPAEARSPLLGRPGLGSPDKLSAAARPEPRAPRPANTSNMLGLGHRDVIEDYELGSVLGQGAFGVVRRCRNRRTGGAFACKTVLKEQLRRRADVEDVRREVQILMMLSSHPNVAALVAIYEDPAAVHMILELCEGGQLFDAIAAAGRTSERAVARHFRRMVEVVQHCHTLGIAHRDIKPDNFLLTQPGPGGVLKAADFGLSQFFRPGRNFKSLVGSAYYVAPEVLARDYGPKADIWSLGVCLHILLSGEPPFWGDTEEEVFAMVRGAPLDFGAPPWPALSPPARDVVRRCLDRDPRRRPSAAQLLQHAWLCQAAPDVDLGPGVVAAVAAFAAATRVKRAAMMVAAQGLGPDRLPQIHALFASLDADGSGALSAEEVRVGLERAGVAVGAAEVKAMVRASGLRRGGGAGLVSLAQFVAATLGHSEAQRDEFAQGLFDGLDADGAGRVPAAALPAALAAYGLGAEEAAAAAAAMGAAPGGSVAAEDFKRWLRGAPSSLQEAVRRRYTEPESPRLDRALGVGGGVEG